MSFVIDASMLAAWLLPDEKAPETDALLDRSAEDRAIAPDLLWHEIRSVVLTAVRRGRVPEIDIDPTFQALLALGLRRADAGESSYIVRLAQRRNLSSYDATYLALALSERLPLATLDRKLAAAARAEEVGVLGPLAAGGEAP